jgi:hypothetical protein
MVEDQVFHPGLKKTCRAKGLRDDIQVCLRKHRHEHEGFLKVASWLIGGKGGKAMRAASYSTFSVTTLPGQG